MTPQWLRPLVDAVHGVGPEVFSRHGIPAVDGSRQSAVLILFTDSAESTDGPGVLLIQRAADMRTHAGQVAFPGGARDPGDPDAAATALREAAEEVGLQPSSVAVLATLPELFLPPSRFLVTPVLGWWRTPHPVGVLDAREVAGVAVLPIAELADPANRFTVRHPSGYEGPAFATRGWFVWGFTAGVLDALLQLGGWAIPWDESVRRPLPSEDVASDIADSVPP